MAYSLSKFKKDILVGTYGTALAYILGLAFLPIITQFYLPEHIGAWQVLFATISLITPIVTLLFESAIVLEKSKIVVSQLLTVVALNALVVSFGLILVSIFSPNFFKTFVTVANPAVNIGWIILVGVLLQTSLLNINALIVKQKNFKYQAISKVLGALTIPIVAISGLLFFEANSFLYMLSALSGVFIQVTFLYNKIDRKEIPRLFKGDINNLFSAIKKYKAYPIYMVPYALSQGAVWQITLISLSLLFSTSTVGAYTIARQLVYVPVSLLTASLKQVIFSYASSAPLYDKNIQGRIKKLLVNIVNIVAPFAVFGFTYLPDIIEFTLGKNWQNVGIFSPWILIPATTLMLTSWLDRLLDVYGRQRLAVFLQIASDILFLLTLLICYIFELGALPTVISLSIFLAIYNLIWLYIVLSILHIPSMFWVLLIGRLFGIIIFSFLIMNIINTYASYSLAILLELLLLSFTAYYTYTKIRN